MIINKLQKNYEKNNEKNFTIVALATSSTFAQVGIGTTTPNGALDITSTTDGLLIPRVALVNTTTSTVTTPTVSERWTLKNKCSI